MGNYFFGYCINCCGFGFWWFGGYGCWCSENCFCCWDYFVSGEFVYRMQMFLGGL